MYRLSGSSAIWGKTIFHRSEIVIFCQMKKKNYAADEVITTIIIINIIHSINRFFFEERNRHCEQKKVIARVSDTSCMALWTQFHLFRVLIYILWLHFGVIIIKITIRDEPCNCGHQPNIRLERIHPTMDGRQWTTTSDFWYARACDHISVISTNNK